jgi:LPS-assembly lipoprotein
MYRRRLLATLAALSMLLTGCGFQLRGATRLPAERSPVYVQAAPGSRIAPVLIQALSAAGTQVTGSPDKARTLVHVLDERNEDRVAAVDSQGKVVGIELVYRVTFDATDAKGAVVAARQPLALSREYVNPNVEVLAKAEEAELIRRDLAREMADRILRRLRAQLL